MKKFLTTAFIVAISFGCWYQFNTNKETQIEPSSISLMNVEALSLGEATVTCGKYCGNCWLRSNSGYCVWSGYQVDYCC